MTENKMYIENGYLSESNRKKYFPNMGVQQIRDEFEKAGLDRHLPIEFSSTEVCIKTPKGILMQVRANDNKALGLWGGALLNGEEPIDGAIREVFEETGMKLSKDKFHFLQMNYSTPTYENGDQARYNAYVFVVKLNEVPEINIDEESIGYKFVTDEEGIKEVLSHEKEIVRKMLKD